MAFQVKLSEDELRLVNNALNEVCNGVHISDREFSTRLGATKEESPSISTDNVKALTNLKDHKVVVPEGCSLTQRKADRAGLFSNPDRNN